MLIRWSQLPPQQLSRPVDVAHGGTFRYFKQLGDFLVIERLYCPQQQTGTGHVADLLKGMQHPIIKCLLVLR